MPEFLHRLKTTACFWSLPFYSCPDILVVLRNYLHSLSISLPLQTFLLNSLKVQGLIRKDTVFCFPRTSENPISFYTKPDSSSKIKAGFISCVQIIQFSEVFFKNFSFYLQVFFIFIPSLSKTRVISCQKNQNLPFPLKNCKDGTLLQTLNHVVAFIDVTYDWKVSTLEYHCNFI